VYARGLCEPAVPRTAVQDVRQEQSCVLGGQAHAHRDGRYHRHCAVQGAFQVTLRARACVRACYPLGVISLGGLWCARAFSQCVLHARAHTYVPRRTTYGMRMAHKPTTRNILPFRCTSMLPRRLSRVASSSRRSHHGSSPPQARAVAALPQSIRCVCGPHTGWRVLHMSHDACCMLLLRVACCMVCVAAHAHTARPGGSVTQSRRRFGW
jgi:hypothetical protein